MEQHMIEEPISPDEVQQELNALERVFSRIDTDDQFLAALLANSAYQSRILEQQNQILSELGGGTIVGAFPTEMSHYVPADTDKAEPHTVTRTPDLENTARITAVSLGWPSGTDNSVGIRLETGDGLKLFPRNPEDDFVAFNDFSETFNLRYELNPGEEIISKTVNFDAQNAHFVNIVPHIEETASQ